jgi:hypothetical protein
MSRVVIAIDHGTPDQNNAVTVYANTKGWHVWHWIENVWLLTDVPEELTPRAVWEEVIALPGMLMVKGVVFRVEGLPLFWGGNSSESWDWMKTYWGKADFPTPQPESAKVMQGPE